MNESAKILELEIPTGKRIICVSDIHGNLDLLVRLLDKVKFSGGDVLLLLGDYYTKGPQGGETLRYVMGLCQKSNVHAIQGNCDVGKNTLSGLTPPEREWIGGLPHIIRTRDYIFVHGGLASPDPDAQEARSCMKNDNFMEQDLAFEQYVVTGHWPTVNYCHRIPSHNPIINHEKRIIAVDGGTIKKGGQLNAFLIADGEFSFEFVDSLPVYRVSRAQPESGGTYNLTWNDRFIELIEHGGEFSLYRHIPTGGTLTIPACDIWEDNNGALCSCNMATDYHLPVSEGETVSVVRKFSDRIFAKKNGVMGWVMAVDSEQLTVDS